MSEKTQAHFPMCEINHNRNLHSTLRKFMTVIAHIMFYTLYNLLYKQLFIIIFLGNIWC